MEAFQKMRKGISSAQALCLVAIGIAGGGVVVENDFLIWSGLILLAIGAVTALIEEGKK